MICAEKIADGRVPLPARSGYISENRGAGAIHGKASRFCRGEGVGTKYPRLRSEKNMTGTWYVFLTYGGFFFFVKGILGFQLVKGKSLRKMKKTQKPGMSRKDPRV